MAQRQKIYEGKAKILYKGPNSTRLIQYFKDDATAFNASKKSLIEGKGILNNLLSEYVMKGLHSHGIPNHFVKRLSMREQLILRCDIIPLEVEAAGSRLQGPLKRTVGGLLRENTREGVDLHIVN